MVDRHTMLIGYANDRGEPRGPYRKSVGWTGRGECIDCNACVAVCPTGIDIRDGSQLECIQCALCIDACDAIMDRVRRPRGLIVYDTIAKREAASSGEHEPLRLVRPRTLIYAALIAIVSGLMLIGLVNRSPLEMNVLHDRGSLFVQLSDGSIRNTYTIKILNKLHTPREVMVSVEELPGAVLSILGQESVSQPRVMVPTDTVRELRAFVTLPRSSLPLSSPQTNLVFAVEDAGSGTKTRRETVFQGPARIR
jgi:cytochrome c oxidase accessory protein FixG